MKRLFKLMAIVGGMLAIGAVGSMDYYTKELISDFPTHLYFVMLGGTAMMLPAFIYGVLKGDK